MKLPCREVEELQIGVMKATVVLSDQVGEGRQSDQGNR